MGRKLAPPQETAFTEDTPLELENLGWNSFFLKSLPRPMPPGAAPARIVFESAGSYRVAGADGERIAEPDRRVGRAAADRRTDLVCGDWVVVDWPQQGGAARIRSVLPRRTCFERRAAGSRTERQAIASNVDTVFVVAGLDGELNLRRIERYLVVAWESGAQPVALLNKADIHPDGESVSAEIRNLAPGVPVIAVSAVTGLGLERLLTYLGPGRTVALLGSSGVGKSSLVNRLLGREAQPTRPVIEASGWGRHTTSARQIFAVPGGGLILDTPGLRELQVWAAEEGLDLAFADIGELAQSCRFRDCRHGAEPGCAVKGAVEAGELDSSRLGNYEKIRRESEFAALRSRYSAARVEKERWKKVASAARSMRLAAKKRHLLDD